MRKGFKKSISLLLAILVFLGSGLVLPALTGLNTGTVVNADKYYNNYSYNYWGDAVPAPPAYLPSQIIEGRGLGVDRFKDPMDVFVAPDGLIYLLDTGNNRILVMDEDFELLKVIDEFDNQGKADGFNAPRGLFVTEGGHIYVADTENFRILELDHEGKLLRIFDEPRSEVIPKDFVYKPAKLVLDSAMRMYVIALSVNQGIMEFDSDGNFMGFMGANKVTPNMLDYFWKLVATKEQRDRMVQFVPTEYNNIAIDADGFLYTTTSALDQWEVYAAIAGRSKEDKAAMIRKLNPTGTDILRRYGFYPPAGDIQTPLEGSMYGHSDINALVVDESGIYTVLDRKGGRVFTYDSDGNLLYIFGAKGNKVGNFRNPVSVAISKDRILVLDSELHNLTVFEPTEYGLMLKSAVAFHYHGKYEEAAEIWEQLLDKNANLDIAYLGLGRSLLRQDDYKGAMKNFKLGDNRDYYSKAFRLYRKEVIAKVFDLVLVGILLLIAAVYVLRRVLKKKKERTGGYLHKGVKA